MTTVAWFHCFAGIAGDMALGACLDAGAPLDEVVAILERLPVTGWELGAEPVMRGGLAATKAHVKAKPDTITRTYGHIAGIIEEARLPDRVRERAQRVFRLLAETEGRLHRRPGRPPPTSPPRRPPARGWAATPAPGSRPRSRW